MAEEIQLQLIRKSLEDLGYYSVADLLAERMAERPSTLLWNPTSDIRVLLATLQEFVIKGQWDAALSILRLDLKPTPSWNINVESLLSDQQRLVAEYIICRFMFLQQVIHQLFGAYGGYPSQSAGSLLLWTLENAMLVYNRINFSDTTVALVTKIPRSSEGAILVPLSMNPPVASALLPEVFIEKILLTTFGSKWTDDVQATYSSLLARLYNVVCYHLRSIITPESSQPGANSYTNIPKNCLAEIIKNAAIYNLARSLYHLPPRIEPAEGESLINSHLLPLQTADGTREDLPIHLLHTLTGHSDEVWFTRFSPLGRYLATGSLDGTCIIYDVANSFSIVAKLNSSQEDEENVFVQSSHKPGLDKKKGIISLCWEPHERFIVTCCLDTVIRVWRVENITQSKRITRSMDDVKPTSLIACFTLGERMRTWPCEFLHYPINVTPHFIVGSPDKVLKVFSVEGEEVLDFYSDTDEWLTILEETAKPQDSSMDLSTGEQSKSESSTKGNSGNGDPNSASQFNRINDFAITPNGKVLITANNDKQVFFYRIPNLFDPSSTTFRIALLSLNGRLTSCSVSANGKYMLISIAPEEIQVWDISPLENFERPFLKQKFLGQSQALYMVRSCFGYLPLSTNEEELVLSGSDDGYVYIWRLQTGQLVTRVRAHHGLCNSVDWNRFYKPAKQGKDYGSYWCSVGDDRLVKIWGPRS